VVNLNSEREQVSVVRLTIIGILGILVVLSGVSALFLTYQAISFICPVGLASDVHCWWNGLSYNWADPNGGGGLNDPILLVPFLLLIVLGVVVMIVGFQNTHPPKGDIGKSEGSSP
jgi:hypothetical protein